MLEGKAEYRRGSYSAAVALAEAGGCTASLVANTVAA